MVDNEQAQQLKDQLKATVKKVQSSDVMNKEYTKMYYELLIKSGKNLKWDFYKKMDAKSVLNYCSKLSLTGKQKIECTVDRDGNSRANQEIIKYMSRPDDGVFQLMETLIELDMTSLVKDFHKEMQKQTISQLLLQTLTEGEQGTRSSIQNGGDNNGNAPGAGSSAGEQEPFQGTRRIEPEGERFKSVGVQPEADQEDDE